ncbi:hypothetical protein ACH5RR_016592 [Cinchona calisaya]|uniref:Pectate lyase domain-containing protein n=1 Tax=Cinchona calisaya TaxID=153742 RepID=A0ABD3A1Z4_9GENT
MLIGADPSHVGDRCIEVTVCHCFFYGTRQRHPRVRFGKVHLYNNYTRNRGIYAVCASVESQAADKDEARSGLIRSEGDLFLSGAQGLLLAGVGEESMFHPSEFYPVRTLESASDSLKAALQICTGRQSIPLPTEESGACVATA